MTERSRPPGRPGGVTLGVAAVLVTLAVVALTLGWDRDGARADLARHRAALAALRHLDQALTAFALDTGRLPRPAIDALGDEAEEAQTRVDAGDAMAGDAMAGDARAGDAMAGDARAGGVEAGGVEAGGVLVGRLPWQALGLAAGAARDPWGRPLTYAVTASLTRAGGWHDGAGGGLTVAWGADPARPGQPRREESGRPWVLVSHGPTGLGAPGPGQGSAGGDPPPGAEERDNLGRPPDPDPARFRASPQAGDGRTPSGLPFDDLLRAGSPP